MGSGDDRRWDRKETAEPSRSFFSVGFTGQEVAPGATRFRLLYFAW